MSLKSKIFLGFSLSVLIIFSLFSLYTFNKSSQIIIEKEEENLTTLSQSIYTQMEKQLEVSEVSALSLAKNTEIQKLFQERNRQELSNILLPVFDSISDNISQIQFHLPDSTSFLRLHDPGNYGDSLKDFRFTVNEANEKKETIRGLEEGVAGFGFRVVVPISKNGSHLGSLEYGSNFGQGFLKELKDNYGGDYFLYTFDDENFLASTVDNDNWQVDERKHVDSLRNFETIYLQTKDRNYNVTLIPFKDYRGEVVGYFKNINDRSLLVKDLSNIRRNSILVTLVLVILLLGLFYIFLSHSFQPILDLISMTERVARGDLTQEIEVGRQDEIGSLALAFNTMISNLRQIISQSSLVSEQVAATSQELSAASEEVTASAEVMTDTISEVAQSANVQVDSNQQSMDSVDRMVENIENVTLSINNINSSTQNTLESAEKGIIASNEAVEKINKLKFSTEASSEEINRLGESSDEIENILGTINEIAEQTNLLALNAAIEAARAGEAGRGFAVVAEEVRQLAEETTNSSNQIGGIISNIQEQIGSAISAMEGNVSQVDESVEIVNRSSSSFSEILNEINKVALQIGEVTRLTKDVSESSQDVKDGFDIITGLSRATLESTKGITVGAQQQAAAMEEIASSAINLASLAEELRNEIAIFEY